MKKRIRRMILAPVAICIAMVVMSSCEEDPEIFEKADIELGKKTDDSTSNKSKPGG